MPAAHPAPAKPRVPTNMTFPPHLATATKDFAQYRVHHPFASITASTRASIVFHSASKCFCAMLSKLSVILEPSAPLGRCSLRAARATKSLGHSYSTTTYCKIFLLPASPFLLCCNAWIFFSHFIFFSLLCCYRLRH